jgi:acetyl esterase
MFGPVEPVFAIEERYVPGPTGEIRARIYRPNGQAELPMLVYFHGGGWVVGGVESHDGVTRFLCVQGRCLVISVAYRLAPEHKFPAAVDDAWAATEWAFGHATEIGADPSRLALGGDSSGGNLAAVVARRARDRGLPVALQLLVYPALDLEALGAVPSQGESSYWVAQYLRSHDDALDPDASPLRAQDLRGLAPAVILSCGLDPLRGDAVAYTRRLLDAGVRAEHLVYPGLVHTAYRMPAVLPGAREMLDDSAAALVRSFGRTA